MPRDTDQLQRIWHSTVYRWNQKRLGRRKRRPFWDVVILTAANLTQARGYEIELERRRALGMIDPETQVVVVPDRAGKRIGSGGATLWALKHYALETLSSSPAPKSVEDLFKGKRVLMMHCGGEGRRVPSNVGTGKLFASLPFEVIPGRAASAFDALYVFLSACGEQMRDGLVVVAGDVLAVFDPARLHWKRNGCSGIGIPAPFELASQHGIYIPDSEGRRVMDYPQKVPPSEMTKRGAAYDEENALVDGAGILRFSPQVCATLGTLAGLADKNGELVISDGLIENPRRRGEGVDLYTDIAWTLVPAMTERQYFQNLSPGRKVIRRALWGALRGTNFWIDVIDESIFIHLGNLWQVLQAFEIASKEQADKSSGDAAAVFGAHRILASHISPEIEIDPKAHVQNSRLDSTCGSVGAHSLIAECKLSARAKIGSRSLVRGIESDADLTVRDKTAIFAVPLLTGSGRESQKMIYCVHGVEDNPKEFLEKGARFFAMPLKKYLTKYGIDEVDLWPQKCPRDERSLWNARLHPVGGSEALELALWMQSGRANQKKAEAWRQATRMSFSEVFKHIDYQTGFHRREALVRESLSANMRRELTEGRDPRECLQTIGTAREFVELRDAIERWIEDTQNPLTAARMKAFDAELIASKEFSDALDREWRKSSISVITNKGMSYSVTNNFTSDDRILKYLDEPLRKSLSIEVQNASLRKVAEAVASGVSRTQTLDLSAVRTDSVLVKSPARIDFGGGWTDTPPQCLERGGVILSAALKLNGDYPIRVFCEKIQERAIRLESGHVRTSETLVNASQLSRFQRLDDPFALVKAGLSTVGFCSQDSPGAVRLEERLEQWGHGLRIVTNSNVPKGSGLGSSSILGAAVIGSLRRLFGEDLNVKTIFRQVMYLEQLLTSGGGWQDQIGALVPGIKLASVPVDKAFVLRPKIEPLQLNKKILNALNRRLVLFYIGKRRVAFNMLRDIVVGYLSGNPDVVHALRALYDLTFEQREALLAGDLERLGSQMTRTRMLYRLMCPGTTSEIIETIFAAASPYITGGKCVGAGGGGFMMMMARSQKDANRVRERLREFSWRGLGEFYDFDIDMVGLHEDKKREAGK